MLLSHCGGLSEHLVEKNNGIFILTHKETCSLAVDFGCDGKGSSQPLTGSKDPAFHVVDATYFRDVLCIYIVAFRKETCVGMYYSLSQRKHSYSVPELKFYKLSLYAALTTCNEAQHWGTLIWGYHICNEEAKALKPNIITAPHLKKCNKVALTHTVKKASTEMTANEI